MNRPHFRPAFRHRVTGQIEITDLIHDLWQLPGYENVPSPSEDEDAYLRGLDEACATYEDGFVDEDGFFHTRDEASAIASRACGRYVEGEVMSLDSADCGPRHKG